MNYTPPPLPKHVQKRKPTPHYNHVKQHEHKQQHQQHEQQQKNDGKRSLHEPSTCAKEHEDEKTAITFLICIGGYLIWYFLR